MDHVEITFRVVMLHARDDDAEQSLEDIAKQVAEELNYVLSETELARSAEITPVKAVDCTTGIEETF